MCLFLSVPMGGEERTLQTRQLVFWVGSKGYQQDILSVLYGGVPLICHIGFCTAKSRPPKTHGPSTFCKLPYGSNWATTGQKIGFGELRQSRSAQKWSELKNEIVTGFPSENV